MPCKHKILMIYAPTNIKHQKFDKNYIFLLELKHSDIFAQEFELSNSFKTFLFK